MPAKDNNDNNNDNNNDTRATRPLSPTNPPSQSSSQRQIIDAPSASGSISSPKSKIDQSLSLIPSDQNPKLEPSIISLGAVDPAHHHLPDEHPPSASTASRFTSNESYFSKQPGASGIEPRSPPTNKRPKGPPASRSSRGINNLAGPPPALSTRRASLFIATTEDPRRPLPAYDHRGTAPRLTPQNLASLDAITSRIVKTDSSITSGIESAYHEAGNREIGGFQEFARDSSLDPNNSTMIASALMESRQSRGEYYAGDEDITLRGNGNDMMNRNVSVERPRLGERANTVGQSQEDLFLALANTDNNQGPLLNGSATREKNEQSSRVNGYKRRSLIYENHTTPEFRPTNEASNEPFQFGSSTSATQTIRNERKYASSAHPLEQRKKARLSSGGLRSSLYAPKETSHRFTSPELPQIYDRRRSAQESASEVPARRYRQPTPQYYSSPLTGRPNTRNDYERASMIGSRTGATESTVSTNAPSTVWDELEDIKTRIRQLELTEILPSSSRASMSGGMGDRPLTANTTVTNASSSPKRSAFRQSSSPLTSVYGEPLGDSAAAAALEVALEQAKTDISSTMYRSMEIAVKNAIAMANISTASGNRQQPLSNVTDRQLRRKADNLCRSLIDVCIALSKERLEWNDASSQPGSAYHDAPTSSRTNSAYHDAIEIHASDAADRTSPTFQRGRSLERRISLGEGSNTINLSEAEFLSRIDPRQYPFKKGSTANSAIERFTSNPQHPASSRLSHPEIQISRTSTVLQRTRPHAGEPTNEHEQQQRPAPPLRPLSRAVTDFNFSRAQSASYPQPSERESSVQRVPTAPQVSPLHRPPSSLLAFPEYNEQRTPSVKSSSIPFRPSSGTEGSLVTAFSSPGMRLLDKAGTAAASGAGSSRNRLEELRAKIARHG